MTRRQQFKPRGHSSMRTWWRTGLTTKPRSTVRWLCTPCRLLLLTTTPITVWSASTAPWKQLRLHPRYCWWLGWQIGEDHHCAICGHSSSNIRPKVQDKLHHLYRPKFRNVSQFNCMKILFIKPSTLYGTLCLLFNVCEQWCEQDQILKTNTKTRTTRPRLRPRPKLTRPRDQDQDQTSDKTKTKTGLSYHGYSYSTRTAHHQCI